MQHHAPFLKLRNVLESVIVSQAKLLDRLPIRQVVGELQEIQWLPGHHPLEFVMAPAMGRGDADAAHPPCPFHAFMGSRFSRQRPEVRPLNGGLLTCT